MDVAGRLPVLHGSGRPLHPKLTLWLGSLAALAAVNAGVWVWLAQAGSLRTPYGEAQLLLSGIYVAVCGFRSLFPRVDLERVCLWDTWLSAILLGRALATIAELCFALQCGLFVRQLSELTGVPLLAAAAQAFVPLAVVAEVCCWYAVLSLNHGGHAIEESLWAVIMLILAAAAGVAAVATDGSLRLWLAAGAIVYGVGGALTLAFDVAMYVRRWHGGRATTRLPLATGLRDSVVRRRPTLAWEVWREEVPWMTLYFSVGVWTSLAMVLLAWV
jgi:hypothetical protein